jgi:hypothetical protein
MKAGGYIGCPPVLLASPFIGSGTGISFYKPRFAGF